MWPHITWMLFALHPFYSKFCNDGLTMVSWPKHVVMIKIKIYFVVFDWNHKLFSCLLDLLMKGEGFQFCFPSPPLWLDNPCGSRLPLWGSSITLRHTTLTRTPLDKWQARRKDLWMTTHNTHKRQTSMPPAGFEPAILSSERSQTTILDRAATGIGIVATWL